jgi:hypothetical protein
MLLQLSRSAKSPYIKLRALELVMLHDGYDLSVLSNGPNGKTRRGNGRSLSDLALAESPYNQQDEFLADRTYSSGSVRGPRKENESKRKRLSG